MRIFIYITLLFSTLVISQDPTLPTINLTELKASPIAHGFGRYASGGRGGTVYKVTNTNASGSGSFKQGYDVESGARTIIFEVGGNIDYETVMFAENGDVTIAGQSAPGDGVAVYSTTGGNELRTGNTIWRHLRFRGTAGARSQLRIYANAVDNVNNFIDHCSFSWADPTEMNIEISGKDTNESYNTTVQYSILGEVDRNILIFKDGHSVSLLRNMFALSNQRSPRYNYPDSIPTSLIGFESINNIMHGHVSPPISPSLGARFTALNNILTDSDGVTPTFNEMIRGESDGTGTAANTYAFLDGNVNEFDPGNIQTALTSYIETSALVATDYTSANGQLLNATDLETDILPYLGAFWFDSKRDTHDASMVSDFVGRTGTYVTDGTLPTLASGTYPTDTDDDGMSDAFEDLHGLDKNLATDRNDTKLNWVFDGLTNVTNTAGYTNLEMYLNYLAKDFDMMIAGIEVPDGSWTLTASTSINPKKFRIGTTITPYFYLGTTKYKL